MFEPLPEEWLQAREGAGQLSAIDVLSHLICAERIPLDRSGALPALNGRSAAELLSIFAELRAQSLQALESFDLGQAELRSLLAAWVVSDLNHTSQATRVLAGQSRGYRAEVGPWMASVAVQHASKA